MKASQQSLTQLFVISHEERDLNNTSA